MSINLHTINTTLNNNSKMDGKFWDQPAQNFAFEFEPTKTYTAIDVEITKSLTTN